MVDPSWFGVAFVFCVLLGLLVWGAQRLLNTLHPWNDFRNAQRICMPMLLRLVLLVLLWGGVATVLALLPLSYLLSIQGWTQSLTSSNLFCILSAAVCMSGLLIAGASFVNAVHWRRKHARGVSTSSRR